MKNRYLSRNGLIDSVKGMLIVLVVFGHLLEIFAAQSPTYTAICSAIYIFHMPLFVMVAGIFSRSELDDKGYKAIFTKLVIPLILFQCLYLGMIAAKSGSTPTPPLQPHWILWFLLSMVIWKLTLPLFVRFPFALPVSVAVAVSAGFNSEIGYAFSLSRTLYFFPFFLAGHMYGKQIMQIAVKFSSVFVPLLIAVIAAIIWWSLNGLPHGALHGSNSYAIAPTIAHAPALGRLLVLALSFLSCLGVLALVPANVRWLQYLGQRTLAIFLLHGFAVMLISMVVRKIGVTPSIGLLPVWFGVSLIIAAVTAIFDPWLIKIYDGLANRLSAFSTSRERSSHQSASQG